MKSPFLSAITEKMRMKYYAEKRLKLLLDSKIINGEGHGPK